MSEMQIRCRGIDPGFDAQRLAARDFLAQIGLVNQVDRAAFQFDELFFHIVRQASAPFWLAILRSALSWAVLSGPSEGSPIYGYPYRLTIAASQRTRCRGGACAAIGTRPGNIIASEMPKYRGSGPALRGAICVLALMAGRPRRRGDYGDSTTKACGFKAVTVARLGCRLAGVVDVRVAASAALRGRAIE